MDTSFDEITQAMTAYFDGFYDGDVDTLKTVFHPSCHLFSAADGQAGLDLYLKQAVYLDLILSELVLPVLSGHRFLQRLYQTNPRQAVLILSAFTASEPHRQFLSDKPWTTLTKPFSLAQVKTAIQQSVSASIPLTKRVNEPSEPWAQS